MNKVVAVLGLTAGLASCAGPAAIRGEAEPRARDIAEVTQRVRQLLAAYASNDVDSVLRLCDAASVVVYGSDASEIARGAAALRDMMAADFKLWGAASFGEPTDLDVRQDGNLASAFFNVQFTVGGQRPVPVRMAMVWHRMRGEWRLIQSSNTVPTVGSSAIELLRR
jgi:ketosteroid isomerase-like protein